MPNKSALIIVDMQNDFVLPDAPACIAGAMATVPKIQKLLNLFRKQKMPVIYIIREYREDGCDIEITRQKAFLNGKKYCVPGTKGCEIVEALKPLAGEYKIMKNRYSSFMNTELDFILRRLGIRTIVVCGTQYPVCVRTTVFDGVALDYEVILVTDAASAQTNEVADANILDMKNIGVQCIDTDTYLKGNT